MFGFVFLWTPPHFWALALMIREHYANAKVPMLPVVRGDRETTQQIVLYTVLLVAITAVPYALGQLGLGYLVAALVLGGALLALAWALRVRTTPRRAAVLFHYSLLYLALLFVAVAVDAAV
jgi:protoheme IX farnesyltransferase